LTDPAATDTDGDGDADELVVAGEGTWTVDDTTGEVTFTPVAGFTNDPTPIKYTVKDDTDLESSEATITVDYPQNPSIAIIKSGTFQDENNDGIAQEGETVLYVFNVINTGNVELGNIAVTDPKVTVVGGPIVLAPGANDASSFTASYTVTQDDVDAGGVTNQALVEGEASDGTKVSDLSDDNSALEDDITITPLIQNPSITIIKSGTFQDENNDSFANEGEVITYEFNITNTGNVNLTNISIDDIRIEITNLSVTDLDIGESAIATVTYTTTEQDAIDGNITNIAKVNASSPTGAAITDTSNDVTIETQTVQTKNVMVARDDSQTGDFETPVTVDVLNNDTSSILDINASTVMIIDPDDNVSTTSLTVAGEGVWSVDPDDGNITFTPENGFVGDPTPIKYTVEDVEGGLSNTATVSVFYTIKQHIGGNFWIDNNIDYIQNNGEVGFNGGTVELLDENGDSIACPTVTPKKYKIITSDPSRCIVEPDANGKYGFPVNAGQYIVKFTFPMSMHYQEYKYNEQNNSNITIDKNIFIYSNIVLDHGETRSNVNAPVNCPCGNLTYDSVPSLSTFYTMLMILATIGTSLYFIRRREYDIRTGKFK
ncbi:MAG: hypothetical protein HF962_00005, partial [Sulfurovum sp.]|nr:hypothetical protein [Sulfurovum sp.]